MYPGRDRIQALELEVARLTGWVRRIASMPEIDQDDAHRLRHMGKMALEKNATSPWQPTPDADGLWWLKYPEGKDEPDEEPVVCRIETVEDPTGRSRRLLSFFLSGCLEHDVDPYIQTHLKGALWTPVILPK